MRASRWLMISLAALLAGATLAPSPAQADTRVRIYLGLGDVLFASGRPYYRHDHSPVYVTYDRWGHRRYYRYAAPPPYGYAYGRPVYYAPAPVYYRPVYRPVPRPVYRDSRWDGDRDDRWDRDDRYERHHRHEGHDDRRGRR
jgi:hypothetical protein